jgi:hypothetical protein
MTPACDATDHYGELRVPCTEPAAGRYRRGCVHEHVFDGWYCAGHAGDEAHARCGSCMDGPAGTGHDCPVLLIPIGDPTP